MQNLLRLRPWLSGARRVSQPLRHTFKTSLTAQLHEKARSPPIPRDYIETLPQNLSKHWDTLPPTPEQLKYADSFFAKCPPEFLSSAPKFATMRFGDSPEVCFLGRSNVGKSSLLNAVLGRKLFAHVSAKPGRTQSMNAFSVGGADGDKQHRLVVLDMPGYGKGGRAGWGQEILKYLSKRTQLKRAFLLIDSEHGVKTTDEQMLALFREHQVPHQVIMSKADKILFPKGKFPSDEKFSALLAELEYQMEGVQEKIQPHLEDENASLALGEIVSCSSEMKIMGKAMGIDAVRHAILQAVELEYRPKNNVKVSEIVPHEEVWK